MIKLLNKHLIWDFDGTLYDTYSQIAIAMLCALNDFGLMEQPSEVFGHLKISVYHTACFYAKKHHLDFDVLMAHFNHEHASIKEFYPMKDLTPCLRITKNMGCRHYVYTHRDHRAVLQLTADDLGYYFTDYITRDDGFPDKPAPDALLYLMKKHCFKPEDAFMIGDRGIDMEAAKNAGIPGILFDPERFYPDIDVPYRLDTMQEITDFMVNLAEKR